MPRIVIDTKEMLPPFPFMCWNSAAIYRVLKHNGFNLNKPYKRTHLSQYETEYIQGEDNAKTEH